MSNFRASKICPKRVTKKSKGIRLKMLKSPKLHRLKTEDAVMIKSGLLNQQCRYNVLFTLSTF